MSARTRPLDSRAGLVLPGAVILLLVLAILVPVMVFWSHQESRVTVKQRKSTTAFHLAEAGVDRGRWKLQETNTYWTITSTGGVIGGYNHDKAYADVDGGQYAVSISSDSSDANRRVIIGVGRDSSTKEVRKIRAIFERQTLDAAIWSGGDVDVDGATTEVHWGPVKAQQDITYNSNRFPRLYARGFISPEPPYCDDPACTTKSDNVQFWAYYDVPPRPLIKFDNLKLSAQGSGTWFSAAQDWNNAYPGGSCTGCPAGVEPKLDDGLVWYFEDDLRLRGGKYFVGTVIVMGELRLEGGGNGVYTITGSSIPSKGYKEYSVIDTAAHDEFYGDAGLQAMTASFQFVTSGPTPNKEDGIKEGVSLRGFLYGRDEFDAQGGNLIHGMILVDKDEVANSGNIKVFYDPAATTNVPIANATLSIVEWKELIGVWPSGL